MGTSASILNILEDDVDIHEVLKDILDQNHISDYHIYETAQRFMENLSADINICVIDLYINSQLSGLDICRQVKQKNKWSYVIVMTGQANNRVTKECIRLKVDGYIDKNEPNFFQELITELRVGFAEAERRAIIVKLLEATQESL